MSSSMPGRVIPDEAADSLPPIQGLPDFVIPAEDLQEGQLGRRAVPTPIQLAAVLGSTRKSAPARLLLAVGLTQSVLGLVLPSGRHLCR